MLRQQRWMRSVLSAMAMIFIIAINPPAYAQEHEQSSLFADIAKHVALDPTTYSPATIAYVATMRDWNSSQAFFNEGYFEHNARFTVSGLPNDVAVGYDEGRRRILRDAFSNLGTSVINNMTDSIIEHTLIARYPEHRRLFRALGWVERVSFASYMSYRLSADHFRQADLNQQRAQQLGLR